MMTTLGFPSPGGETVRVAVYTDRPQILRPLVEANHQFQATFFTPAQYSPKPNASIVILDRFDPAAAPALPSLWIDPPKDHSPVPVRLGDRCCGELEQLVYRARVACKTDACPCGERLSALRG